MKSTQNNFTKQQESVLNCYLIQTKENLKRVETRLDVQSPFDALAVLH